MSASRAVAVILAIVILPAVRPPVPSTSAQPAVPQSVHGVVGAGTRLGAEAGLRMLKQGGNAVDAGVAALLAAAVLEVSHFGFGGEAPILIYAARDDEVVAVNGIGTAPGLATVDWFRQRGHQRIPGEGILAATVPGVLAAALAALERYGTLTFEQVVEPATRYADGFPVYPYLAEQFRGQADAIRRIPSGARVYLPDGRVPREGETFRQPDLARTLRRLVEVERAHRTRGRAEALRAVGEVFYTGEIAREIDRYLRAQGGLLRFEDLAGFAARLETPPSVTYRERYRVYKMGFSTQGPVLLQSLNILERFDLRPLGHNVPGYLHLIVEAMKLAFADRDTYYGDAEFADVPARGLLSKTYAADRARLIDRDRASLERRPGRPWDYEAGGRRPEEEPKIVAQVPRPAVLDGEPSGGNTTTITVIDRDGNMFSATPSGAWFLGGTHVVPDLGIPLSTRLQSAELDPDSPNALQPGKRPRVTLTPSLAFRDDRPFLAFSSPGGEGQDQALLQLFLNIVEFGMNPVEAVRAPRVATDHLISSFASRAFHAGQLRVEDRISAATIAALRTRGHRVVVGGPWSDSSAPTVVLFQPRPLGIYGGADPRRDRHVLAW